MGGHLAKRSWTSSCHPEGVFTASKRTRVSPPVEAGATDTVTIFLQDKLNPMGYSQVLEEKDTPSGTPDGSYVIGNDVIAQADGSNVRAFLYDGGGSTRALLDGTGQPITDQVYAYDAFGTRIEDPGSPITPVTNLLYRGEYFDTLLGQYQLRARYYNPRYHCHADPA